MKEGDSTRARPTPVKQASSVPRIVCGLLKRYTASRLSASDDGFEAGSGESGTMAESACAHGAAAREQSGANLSVAIEGRTAAGLKHEALLRQRASTEARSMRLEPKVCDMSGKRGGGLIRTLLRSAPPAAPPTAAAPLLPAPPLKIGLFVR